MTVAIGGAATLLIEDGASVTATDASLGVFFGTTGTVTVTGVGSRWTMTGGLVIGGGGGTGKLTISPGAAVSVAQNIEIRDDGALNLEGGTLDTESVTVPGTLHVGTFNGDLLNQGLLTPTYGYVVISCVLSNVS